MKYVNKIQKRLRNFVEYSNEKSSFCIKIKEGIEQKCILRRVFEKQEECAGKFRKYFMRNMRLGRDLVEIGGVREGERDRE